MNARIRLELLLGSCFCGKAFWISYAPDILFRVKEWVAMPLYILLCFSESRGCHVALTFTLSLPLIVGINGVDISGRRAGNMNYVTFSITPPVPYQLLLSLIKSQRTRRSAGTLPPQRLPLLLLLMFVCIPRLFLRDLWCHIANWWLLIPPYNTTKQ